MNPLKKKFQNHTYFHSRNSNDEYFENFKKPTYLNIRACLKLIIIINKHLVNYIIRKFEKMMFSNFIQIIPIAPFAKNVLKKHHVSINNVKEKSIKWIEN
jgi:hypothetical protein